MKRLITLLGTFLFTIFCELFVRVVIMIYQQTEPVFYGSVSLPGWPWVVIFATAILISTWISGMLASTITNSAHPLNFVLLFLFLLIWRISEYFANPEPELFFSLLLIGMHCTALILAYITKLKINDQISDPTISTSV